jgi:hypothetical protein
VLAAADTVRNGGGIATSGFSADFLIPPQPEFGRR